jgi:hypothetical protein
MMTIDKLTKITIVQLSIKIRYHQTMLHTNPKYHQNLINLYTNKSLRLQKLQ